MRVLLVDEDKGRAALLKQALQEMSYDVIFIDNQNAGWHRQVQNTQVDMILIHMDSPDRDTLEYLTRLKHNQPKPVVMFANDDDHDIIEAAVKAGVSAYVLDGVNIKRVRAVLDVAIARFNEYQTIRQELEVTKTKLAERKSIDKAKGLLMQHKQMTEDEAYHAMRKMAMARNLKLVDIAEQLIAMADILI